jgi:hypothetical protein
MQKLKKEGKKEHSSEKKTCCPLKFNTQNWENENSYSHIWYH